MGCADINMRQYPEMHPLHSPCFLYESFSIALRFLPVLTSLYSQACNAEVHSRLLPGILKPDPAGNEIYCSNSGMEMVGAELL